MKALSISLLDNFRITDRRGNEISLSSKKARALLALLVVRGGRPASRVEVANLLWEYHEEPQALTNLRQSLSVLNKVLGPVCDEWLVKSPGMLAIDPQCFDADIYAIENIVASADRDWIGGDFLCGLRLHGEALNQWIIEQRRHYHAKQADALRRGLDAFQQRGDHARVIEIAQRLVSLDPIDEEAHRILMRSYSALGQQHRVLRQYQQCCLALETCDLGEPQPQTQSVFQSLYRDTVIQSVFEKPVAVEADAGVQEDVPFIAVLPMRAQGIEDQLSALPAALTEEIVTELRRFQGFKVISALTSLSLENRALSLSAAAAELGARYLVSGSIRQFNRTIQVMVELVDAHNGEVIWAEKYRREACDLFLLNAELAKGIAGAIEPETSGHALLLSKRKSPASMTAWELVLQGDHELYLQLGTQWSSRKARGLYQQAMQLAPDYAPAYAGYAYSLCLDLKENLCDDRDAVARRMQEYAEQGVALDSNNPFCHVVMGRVYHQQQDYQLALANYRKAVELCPSSAKAHFGLGFGLAATGEYDAAIESITRAQTLSPRDPFSWVFHTVKALSHMYAERFEAAETAASVSSAYPKANHWASLLHASSLVRVGRYEDAFRLIGKIHGNRPGMTARLVEDAFPVAGNVDSRSISEGLIDAGLPKG